MKSDQPGVGGEALAHYQVIRRNGAVVPFEPSKIAAAMTTTLLAVHGCLTHRGRSQTLFEGLMRSVVERVSGVGRGFFSAAKPNLRNAP